MNRFRCLAALAAVLLVPAAAAADVLVTTDGATLETRGPWKVQGRQVVFTLPNGTLSSLRADAVDLDASAQATARAAEAAAAPPAVETVAPLGEPVLRITEKDIPPSPEAAEGEGEGDGEASAGGENAAAGNVPLEVVSWDKIPIGEGDGVQVFGTVRNNGTETVIGPAISVSVYGAEGGLLALTDAEVNLTAIPAGKSANFRADFPGLPDFAALRFNLSGRGYEGRPPADAAAEGEETVDPDELEYDQEPTVDVDAPPPA